MLLFKQNNFSLNENNVKPKCGKEMEVEQLSESVHVGTWNLLFISPPPF